MTKQNRHSCPEIDNYLTPNPSYDLIEYISKTREYWFVLHQDCERSAAVQPFFYCPWCGEKFPEALYEKWEEVLEQDYGLTSDEIWDDRSKTPEELRTDEWWKKRGL